MVVGCVGTGYVLRVELHVQRRLCPIFVRDVGSPDIHECFRGLTGSQRTPGILGVTSFFLTSSIFFHNFAQIRNQTFFFRHDSELDWVLGFRKG